MKEGFIPIIGSIILAAQAVLAKDALVERFKNPPSSARPTTYWQWMNGSVTKEGISADLEVFSQAGLGGVTIFNSALIGKTEQTFITPSVKYLSPEWEELFRHTLREADRLGLKVAFQNCAGYSESGSPQVTPDKGMKRLTWSECSVLGGKKLAEQLPLPPTDYGIFQGPAQPGHHRRFGKEPANLASYYRDIAVLAFPTPDGDGDLPLVPDTVTTSVPMKDSKLLWDRNYGQRETLPIPTASEPVWVQYAFKEAVTVRSVTMSCLGFNWYKNGELQSSDDGENWVRVCPLTGITRWDRFLPCTTAVPETQSRFFRLVFTSAMERAKRFDITEARLSSSTHLDHWEIKAGYAPAKIPTTANPPIGTGAAIGVDQIKDLTSCVSKEGKIEWDVPPGRWTILRLGYTPMGVINHPATPEATGLEVDKLDRAAVEEYFAGGPKKIISAAGTLAGSVLNGVMMDSWEVNAQNCTPKFMEEFRKRRGYDPVRWLPVMAGRIVADGDKSERFLFDVRQTLAELLSENHYGTIRKCANQSGLALYAEATGPYDSAIADNFAAKGKIDVPVGEFWNERKLWEDAKQTVAAAQVYGKRIAAAEAFTSEPETSGWKENPADLKVVGDMYFAAGINQFVLHTAIHQPRLDCGPGLTLDAYGCHFDRTNGWLKEGGGAWLNYLTRCQYLLRQGLSVVDVCYFVGEDIPNWMPLREQLSIPAGYDYGGCNPEALLTRMDVRDGLIVLPDGMSYHLLVLSDRPVMSIKVARKIKDLVLKGATVLGPKPLKSPSLSNYPDGDGELRTIADSLWGVGNGEAVVDRKVGKGRVIFGKRLQDILPPPDFEYAPTQAADLQFAHRRDGNTDIYFVSNQSAASVAVDASFRVSGKQPERWNAETGEAKSLGVYKQGDGKTTLPLTFDPYESAFVVFRHRAAGDAIVAVASDGKDKPLSTLLNPETGDYVLTTADGKTRSMSVEKPEAEINIAGPWEVAFPGDSGVNSPLTMTKLASWSDNNDKAVKYFSGTAAYRINFEMPRRALRKGERFMLDLGEVEKFASITLNGVPVQKLWHPPYVADVTKEIKDGKNRLTVQVTNLLVNKLIGDQQLPENERKMWSTYLPYKKDSPLLRSGLLGPVKITVKTDWVSLP